MYLYVADSETRGIGHIFYKMSSRISEKELLPIVVQENTALIDERPLHQQLQIGRDFSNWIEDRIQDY
jgi:hypothetical protein